MASRERKKTNLNKMKRKVKEDEEYELKSFVIICLCIFLRIEIGGQKSLNVHMEIVFLVLSILTFYSFEKKLNGEENGVVIIGFSKFLHGLKFLVI
jgi:hypothetical protein